MSGTAGSSRREIAPAIFWLDNCSSSSASAAAGQAMHLHFSSYLVRGASKALLYDTTHAPYWGRLEADLEALLGGRPLDYIVCSHTELPHSGNVGRLLEKYPEALLLGDVRDYHLYHPAYASRFEERRPGDDLDLGGGHRFVFQEAVLRDLPNTIWGWEQKGQVMFTSDGFLYPHHQAAVDAGEPVHAVGECSMLSNELPSLPSVEVTAFNVLAAMYWTRFQSIDAAFERFLDLLERYPTRVVAPAHGNVIVGNINELVQLLKDAIKYRVKQAG